MLCTEQATYAIKHVETTNTLFMVSGSEESHGDMGGTVSVKATSAAHLELTQSAPQLRELDTVLEVGSMGPGTIPVCLSGQSRVSILWPSPGRRNPYAFAERRLHSCEVKMSQPPHLGRRAGRQ